MGRTQGYGLSQPDYNGSVAAKSGRESGCGRGFYRDVVSRPEPQRAARTTKREIKGGTIVYRLTEHSMQLGNLCEKQKAEIAELRKQLSSYEMELDAKGNGPATLRGCAKRPKRR